MLAITSRTRLQRTAHRLFRVLGLGMAGGLLLCTSATNGQVRPVQGGNALDANPMAGAGGYNAVRPVTSGVNSNLIVTGNVTGGRAFRAFSPIQDPSTLQTNIPSAGIGDFVRDSVGLPSISAGLNNYTPRPYYNPASTTVASGTVQNQALLPRQATGSFSVNQYQGQMPVSPLTGNVSPNQISSQLPYAAPTWEISGTGMFRPDIVMGAGNPLSPYSLSSPAEVSGVRSTTETSGTTGTTGTDTGRKTLPAEAPLTQLIRPEFGEQPQTGPLSVQPSTAGGTPAANLALLPGTANTSAQQPSQDTTATAGQAAGQTARTGQEPPTDSEATSTLLTAMQRYTKSIQAAISPETPKLETPLEAAARTPADKILLMPSGMTEAQQQRARADIDRQQAAELVDARLRVPIRTLAGMQRTQVDRQLARAESLMQQEQYYRASQVYGSIVTTNPDNPLAWLGRANALLAAGDYVSAYQALEQGVQRFPQMLQFNFDLPALVGNREVLDVRRAEIEQTLATKPSYQLQFLLGYLEYFSGLKDLGLQTLRQAAEAAPTGSIVPEAYRTLTAAQAPATQLAR